MLCRASRADYPNLAFFAWFGVTMDSQQHRDRAHDADGVPPLLTIKRAIGQQIPGTQY